MAKKKSKKERGSFDKLRDNSPAAQRQEPVHFQNEAELRVSTPTVSGPDNGPNNGLDNMLDDSSPLSAGQKRQRVYDDVRAQREARRGPDLVDDTQGERSRTKSAKDKDAKGKESAFCSAGYVRRSTLYLSVALALVAGLFMGPLLPGLAGHNLGGAGTSQNGGQSAGQGSGQTEASTSAQASAQNDNAAKLAGHILELEEAVRKNPQDVAAWVQLGNLYFDSGKAPQSINAYERALLLKPDNANVLTDLGIMYRDVGKFDLAVESFRKATLVDAKHQNALFNRGVVLFFDLKRKEEGRKVWQELLALNPQAKAPDGKSLKDMLRDLK